MQKSLMVHLRLYASLQLASTSMESKQRSANNTLRLRWPKATDVNFNDPALSPKLAQLPLGTAYVRPISSCAFFRIDAGPF